MALFGNQTSKLAAGPTLLLAADPGPALLAAARRYDPQLRRCPPARDQCGWANAWVILA
jgi:hypothetical protein